MNGHIGFFSHICSYAPLRPYANFEENRRGSPIGPKFGNGPSLSPRAAIIILMTGFCLESSILSNDMQQARVY